MHAFICTVDMDILQFGLTMGKKWIADLRMSQQVTLYIILFYWAFCEIVAKSPADEMMSTDH